MPPDAAHLDAARAQAALGHDRLVDACTGKRARYTRDPAAVGTRTQPAEVDDGAAQRPAVQSRAERERDAPADTRPPRTHRQPDRGRREARDTVTTGQDDAERAGG